MTKRYIYLAEVINVVDGDTVDIKVDLGFRVYQQMRVRLAGIDAEEKNSTDENERALAMKAKHRVVELCSQKQYYVIETFKVDKYGRYLAKIFLDSIDGPSVNETLVVEGLAKVYDGGKR